VFQDEDKLNPKIKQNILIREAGRATGYGLDDQGEWEFESR
jgi:hypothetical protein